MNLASLRERGNRAPDAQVKPRTRRTEIALDFALKNNGAQLNEATLDIMSGTCRVEIDGVVTILERDPQETEAEATTQDL